MRATADGNYSPDAPPARPPALAGQSYTAGSAEEFAQYYIDVLNHAWFTGETAELRRISLPGCESCSNFIESIEGTYVDGYMTGGAIEIASVRVSHIDDDYATITSQWKNGVDVRWRGGAEVGRGDSASAVLGMRMDWKGDSWRMGHANITGQVRLGTGQ